MVLGSIFPNNVDRIGQSVSSLPGGAEGRAAANSRTSAPEPTISGVASEVASTSADTTQQPQESSESSSGAGYGPSASADTSSASADPGYDATNGINGPMGYSLWAGYGIASNGYQGLSEALTQYEQSSMPMSGISLVA